jgi:hypothetical protein
MEATHIDPGVFDLIIFALACSSATTSSGP